ncbi:MAG: murein L,D-transpeptidase [Aquificaceae bacterium]
MDIKANWNRLLHPEKVYELYRLLNFKCIWLCNGRETNNFYAVQHTFKDLLYHGIRLKESKSLNLELALTDKLIDIAYKLYYGSVDPSKLYSGWNFPKKPDRVINILANLLKEDRIKDLLVELSPKSEEYWFLVEHAKYLEELCDFEWKPIRLTKVLKPGAKYPCIDEIRFRLFLLGDLKEYNASESFDKELLEAIKSFQKRHGLPETGFIDKRTIQELNISPADRLKQIYLNLEKHRWIYPLKKILVVNIPSFELYIMEENKILFYSRVIVGRDYKEDLRPTPMLYSKVDSITINPKWYVPTSISVKDILPKVKKDPNYLIKKGFKVFYAGKEVNPLQVDWSIYDEKNFPFRFVQEPGPQNALGRIKFNSHNPFQVFLHDTPDKHLFKHTKRSFSSGCIRVEKAEELALYLLGQEWTRERLRNLIKKGETITIKLKEEIPLYLLYFTAFKRGEELHFREDLYGYDTILSKVLFSSGGER